MRTVFFLALLSLLVSTVSAQVRRSSRNLEPFNKRSEGNTATTRSGNTGMNIASPPREADRETITKVTFLGPKKGWGFVQKTSPYYTLQGKCEGTLPGGTPFKYTDVKATSKNAMLVCTVQRGEVWEGPFLLDCTAVAAYDGNPEALNPATVRNLGAYFTLQGKIAARKEALADAALALNPNLESARRAYQAYQDSITKAAAMEKQMNTLTGPGKAKADEALRALKYEQVRIKAKAENEARAYNAWKASHPADPAKLAADPQLQALEKELQQAKAAIPTLVPPAS